MQKKLCRNFQRNFQRNQELLLIICAIKLPEKSPFAFRKHSQRNRQNNIHYYQINSRRNWRSSFNGTTDKIPKYLCQKFPKELANKFQSFSDDTYKGVVKIILKCNPKKTNSKESLRKFSWKKSSHHRIAGKFSKCIDGNLREFLKLSPQEFTMH